MTDKPTTDTPGAEKVQKPAREPRRPKPDPTIKTPIEVSDLPTYTREFCAVLNTNQKHLINDSLFRLRDRLQKKLDSLGGGPGSKRTARQLDSVGATIVDVNYGLVKSYAGRFSRDGSGTKQNVNAEDYEAAGEIGLIRGMNSFNPDQGVFSDWAFKYIKREVLEQVRKTEFPFLSNADFERRPKIKEAQQALRETTGREPTVDEVKDETGMKHSQVDSVVNMPASVSLSDSIGADYESHGVERGELLSEPSTDVGLEMMIRDVLWALRDKGFVQLSEKEQRVLIERHGLDDTDGRNLSDIGADLNLSRETVRQIEKRAVAKLQHPVVLREIWGLRDHS